MVHVTSEIGRLRKVLVHEPGPEVDRMVPPMMEELLFDDILFGDRARDEHRRFRRLLQVLGIEVVEANTLLAEALAGEEARAWLWARLRPEAPQVLRANEPPASAEEAVAIAVAGLRAGDDCRGIEVEDLFRLPPLPNWCFQRDPQVVLGDGVIFSAMATAARWREGLLTRCIFRFHPELAGTPVILDPLREARESGQFFGPHRPRLEGGDVLVLSPRWWPSASRSAPTRSLSSSSPSAGAARRRPALAGDRPRSRTAAPTCTSTRSSRRSTETRRWSFEPVICGDGPQLADTYEIDLDHPISHHATGMSVGGAQRSRPRSASRYPAAATTRWRSSASSGPTAPTRLLWPRASSCSTTAT